MKYGTESIQEYDMQSIPLLMLIHGGGWSGGDKDADNFKGYQGDGFNVISMNYHLSPQARWYEAVLDIRRARILLQKRLNPSKVILCGTSAGANLASLTYTIWPHLFHGFIGFYGAYDLTRKQDYSAKVNGMIDVFTPSRRQASPIFKPNVKNLNALLIHGGLDETILPIQSELMSAAIPGSKLIINQTEIHAFEIADYSDKIKEFIENS